MRISSPLVGVAAGTLCFLSLAVALPAEASTATSPRPPIIEWVNGSLVDYGDYTGDDDIAFRAGWASMEYRKATFLESAPDATSGTERMTVRTLAGVDLCQSRVALPDESLFGRVFRCTTSAPLAYGMTKVEAVITPDKGERVSDYVVAAAAPEDPTSTATSRSTSLLVPVAS